MLGEVVRFHRRARRVLADPTDDGSQTLSQFLAEGNFSPYFIGALHDPGGLGRVVLLPRHRR